MLKVFMQVIVLFSLIAVGYVCKRMKLLSNNINQDVSNLLVYVTLPAMIIVSLSGLAFSQELLVETMQLLGISVCMYLFFILLSYILVKMWRVEETTKDIFQFGLTFGNSTFLGYPVAYAVYGQQGLFFMAVCDTIFPLFLWTFGVMVMCRPIKRLSREEGGSPGFSSLKKMINPGIIAVIIGFILLGTSLELPEAVSELLQLLGSVTTPLAMIFIGSVLGDIEIKAIIRDYKSIHWSLQKLILLPFIVFCVLRFSGFQGYLVSIPVLYTAMPVGAMTSVMAAKYGNDYQLASRLIFISTLLSIFTIPVVVWILSLC